MKPRPTRFVDLGYAPIGRGLWMFIDQSTGAQIGPQYPTKGQLLASIEAFATERGFSPKGGAP